MQEYWELYMKNIDGKPASVLFNAGISMDIDEVKDTYSQIAFIKIALKEPNENGLLGENELPEINYIEDKLEASLIKFRIGKYVGKVVSDGSVTFIYYLQFTYNWQDFLVYALEEFGHYTIESGFQDDQEWNYYHKLLYPNTTEWQLIQNHKACDHLKANGDTLNTPRAIEHTLFLGEGCDKEALSETLESEGFKILSEVTNEAGIKGLKFYRIDKPFYYDIDTLTLHLIDTLQAHGANYDGWESSVVKG